MNPTWLPGPPMWRPRKFANAVLLPDSSVLVVGGGTTLGHGVLGGGQLEAEMFYQGNWVLLAPQQAERTYHSVALLLPDGRVLSAGGDSSRLSMEYEIFVPPYLEFAPTRPTISQSAPTAMQYGSYEYFFGTGAPFGQGIAKAVLMRPGSVTHSQDSNQRYEELAFTAQDSGITVKPPANATLAPPGWYMMFVISSAGVPSLAHWVELKP